jgi:hypothetical protein
MRTKLLVVFGLVVTALFANPSFESKNTTNVVSVETTQNCNYGQCQATAKSTGNQCKHCVSDDGDKYCWQHKK